MNILKNFSERLKDLMFEHDIKSKELAIIIGVDSETIRLWKNGQRLITLRQLLKLVDFFNCSLEFLAGRTEQILDYTPQPVMPFYESLRKIMREQEITRYKLIKETKIYDSYLTNWKNGKDPHFLTLIDLADYFQVTLDYLVGRDR